MVTQLDRQDAALADPAASGSGARPGQGAVRRDRGCRLRNRDHAPLARNARRPRRSGCRGGAQPPTAGRSHRTGNRVGQHQRRRRPRRSTAVRRRERRSGLVRAGPAASERSAGGVHRVRPGAPPGEEQSSSIPTTRAESPLTSTPRSRPKSWMPSSRSRLTVERPGTSHGRR